MTWSVDKPRRVGELTIAAIVDSKVSAKAAGPVLTGTGKKQPLVIVQLQNGTVTAVDLNGQAYDADDIELLYPTALAQVRARFEQTE